MHVCTTHHYAHDCGWYKTEESWHPAEKCEDQCSCNAGQEGILGEVGGVSCECLLCGHCRLSENHLWACCVLCGRRRMLQDLNKDHHARSYIGAVVLLYCRPSMQICTKDKTVSNAHTTPEVWRTSNT